MEKLVVFNDFANIDAAYRQSGRIPDYRDLLRYLSEGRFLVEAHAFVPIDPRGPHARDAIVEELWGLGYLTHTKIGASVGESYKCDFDVEITLELMRTAELVKPDIVVLISGDKDFIPVILELRRRGVRVEVAAFPDINAAREVMLKASGFIDLERYLREREALETDEQLLTAALEGRFQHRLEIDDDLLDDEAAGDEAAPWIDEPQHAAISSQGPETRS